MLIASNSVAPSPRPWQVSALCRFIADRLQAELNPVRVQGEISGFTRAASGHCYFSIKDDNAQMRCAMFKRHASSLRFAPRDGMLVELTARVDLYAPRGDLQLIVEDMSQQGQGDLFERFLRLKEALQAEGLFDAERKRRLPAVPRRIGLVTSLGAAALHDVATALQRRAPHVRVVLAPASVQGETAPAELVAALHSLYDLTDDAGHALDAILLVRGGGSLEDLWAFNDEGLARCIAASPVPVVCGVGHETDFSIADFVADVRAPTPTAAAEIISPAQEQLLALAEQTHERLQTALQRWQEQHNQRLDQLALRLGRPTARVERMRHQLQTLHTRLLHAKGQRLQRAQVALDQAALRLQLLDPKLVLQRGYAWLSQDDAAQAGPALTSVEQLHNGQSVRATLHDGSAALTVVRVDAH
ncbi:exodeoxyribonuclease VII large subunit [Curvibacter sp. CHRR-16]|uniref:exodeoxyribonuclease VII large subunit n=1 Tax=Curvibacter sp. CHRR-16 TaxID=2835872 RepID=UPI001BDA176E|nr:exodeoxyribonuclease VII large subunit [Curvibacter sp. CHRR-16]MBT0569248.1 exodeoxyribonuclease VII large subunit [Curvibacter sp. CHRR-16]